MDKKLEKELRLRISMLEAKVDVLMSLVSTPYTKLQLEEKTAQDFEQQEIENEMHNDLMVLSA